MWRLISSEPALEWIMENLVDDGDEVVAVRVLDYEEERTCFRTYLSAIIDQKKAREAANNLLSAIVELNRASGDERKVRATCMADARSLLQWNL